ncbi:MAG: hypothetical protein PHX20_02005 [Candidatus Omnitrophica bacterium]|nr:hypothetical protein [Candidatus Omnitrophota bacterium]MDD5436295.1 hypothetical protein [Candidatus Omnitrophota bacterium]
MKKWMVIAVGILVVIFILGIAKDLVIKVAVESGTQIVTGLKLKIGGFRIGMLNTLVDIRNLRILNPAGFKDKNMLNMPEIYVDYDLPAIFKGKVHLTETRINMREFTVVKNEKGKLNLDSLKVVQAQKSGGKTQEKAGGKVPEIQIDKLRLKIGKVVYKDYSRGGEPSVKEFNVNIDEQYTNITNPYTLVSLIVVKALMNTSIAGLANFDLKGLSGSVSGTLASAQKMTAQASETAQKATKTAIETTQKAAEAASKAKDAVSGVFKSPF